MSNKKLILLGYQIISSLAGLCAWPFFYQHLRSRGGGESFLYRLGLKLPPSPPPGSPRLWIHGVSVGEIASAPPLVAELQALFPTASFIISTGTETGQALARRLLAGERRQVCYFPLDLPWAVSRMLKVMRPDAFIALESELWPNFLTLAKARGVRLALLNARLSDRSYRRYTRVPNLAAAFFNLFEVLAAGSPEDFQRLQQLGVAPEKLHLTGNLKVDRLLRTWPSTVFHRALPFRPDSCGEPGAPAPAAAGESPAEQTAAALHLAGAPVFLAASTHAGEETVVLDAYRQLVSSLPALVLLLAPRHPERTPEVERLAAARGLACQRFSRLKTGQELRHAPVVLVDTIGDLFSLYRVAHVAFVGGSLVPHGGQNLLEPAVWGVPPLSGPHLHNFRWAQEILAEAGALIIVQDQGSLVAAVQRLLGDPELRQRLGTEAQRSLQPHQGAAARQAKLVQELLASSPL